MDREPRRRRLPSHGTLIAYAALFLALCGSGYAATQIGGGIKVTCSATRARKRVSCRVVGTASRGPQGPQGPRGPQGPPGTGGSSGPTAFTQEPAYTVDPTNSPNFLTPIATSASPYLEGQFTVAEDAGAANNAQSDVYMPLQSPSRIAGSTAHVSSVQFCINISPQTNSNYTGTTSVSVDKATVYELNEPSPGGGAGSGTAAGPPAYSPRTVLLQQTYTGETQIDNCLTATASSPQAVSANGYLILAITIGLTTNGAQGGFFGTNYVSFGRVTTTYTP
jgi:hypothetical protein